jgi:hypothetical protein
MKEKSPFRGTANLGPEKQLRKNLDNYHGSLFQCKNQVALNRASMALFFTASALNLRASGSIKLASHYANAAAMIRLLSTVSTATSTAIGQIIHPQTLHFECSSEFKPVLQFQQCVSRPTHIPFFFCNTKI